MQDTAGDPAGNAGHLSDRKGGGERCGARPGTGADDYIIKPFRNRELISRITAVLRRYHKEVRELTCGGIRVDLGADRVYADGEEVSLTALEQKILILLLDHQGQTVTREQILMHIWDYAGNVVNDNTLSVYIKRLREKLGTAQISTVKGIGYRLEEQHPPRMDDMKPNKFTI